MKAGVIDGNNYSSRKAEYPREYHITPAGNVYLHEVLDMWLEEIRPMLKERCSLFDLRMILSSDSKTKRMHSGCIKPYRSVLRSMVLLSTRRKHD
jgi:hypothetical protein